MIHFIYYFSTRKQRANYHGQEICNTISKYIRSLNVIITRFIDNGTITSNYHPVASIPISYLQLE